MIRVANRTGGIVYEATTSIEVAGPATAPREGTDRGRIVLLAILALAGLGTALVLIGPLLGRPGVLERYRLEIAGLSVACLLVALLSLGGIV